ncbi:FecR family protein [Enterovirga rhinocerotis]|uniref:FecR family protein n=1 Tax=Enterovirga rhinocerotis TaxID=1339210 RepID=A0A4R7BHX4_9HYPH|nr:FecR domain-containing protein [Enterovirga rhinocerotis]TDR84523.1 FecR family protein [Enterovirga rhinocerotis]
MNTICETMDDRVERGEGIRDKAGMDARDWVARISSGTMSDAELDRFKAWRAASPENDAAFLRERAFWQELGALDARPPLERRPPRQAHSGRRAFLVGGSAAIAASAVVVAAPRLRLLWDADHRTAAGEQREVSLPDGTRVALNTDSALAVRYEPGLRLVALLRGEALFDVKADGAGPFRVAAQDGITSTDWGSFAVRATDDEVAVTVTAGRTSVVSPGPSDPAAVPRTKAIEIDPAQQTRYRPGGLPLPAVAVDLGQELAWRTGRVIFDGRPFAEALAELGRYVPERIVLADRDRARDPVSAVFSIREAGAAIAALAETQGLATRRIPGIMIVVG